MFKLFEFMPLVASNLYKRFRAFPKRDFKNQSCFHIDILKLMERNIEEVTLDSPQPLTRDTQASSLLTILNRMDHMACLRTEPRERLCMR